MTNPKVRYGDIFSKNITGHEVIVCDQETESDNNGLFFRVDKNGYNFTVRSIEYLPKEMDTKSRLEAINEYFELVYVLAKPLPAHPYFTVRIPFLFCSETEDSWKTVAKIINEKLVYRSIPVEIWMPLLTSK